MTLMASALTKITLALGQPTNHTPCFLSIVALLNNEAHSVIFHRRGPSHLPFQNWEKLVQSHRRSVWYQTAWVCLFLNGSSTTWWMWLSTTGTSASLHQLDAQRIGTHLRCQACCLRRTQIKFQFVVMIPFLASLMSVASISQKRNFLRSSVCCRREDL